MVFSDLRDEVPKHCGNMPGLADYVIYSLHISQNSHVYVKWRSYPIYIDQDSSYIILDHSTKCKTPGKKNLVNVKLAWFFSWIGIFFYLDIFSCFYYWVQEDCWKWNDRVDFSRWDEGVSVEKFTVHNTWFCLANSFCVLIPRAQLSSFSFIPRAVVFSVTRLDWSTPWCNFLVCIS